MGNLGLKYSDIVYGVYYPRFSPDPAVSSRYWYNAEALESLLRGEPRCPVPYVDYAFEYPPLVGLLWYSTTCLSALATAGEHRPSVRVDRIAELHFALNAAALSIFVVLSVLFLWKLAESLGWAFGPRVATLWLLLPSTVLYSVYNWDAMCAALALGSLVAFARRRYLASGLLLGASVAAKLMTASVAYVLFLHLLFGKRGDARLRDAGHFLAGLAVAGALPYLALLALSPAGFRDFVTHHYAWYCENCLYMVFVHDIHSPAHRLLAIASVSALAAAVALLVARGRGSEDGLLPYRLSAVSALGAVLSNYVFSPQMVLLFSPLVLAFSRRASRALYAVSDVANFSIMFSFFRDYELRLFLREVGIPVSVRFSPWTIDSPVQWFAAARNLLLLVVLVIEVSRLSRSCDARTPRRSPSSGPRRATASEAPPPV